MNNCLINSTSRYIETLYEMNRKLVKVCGYDCNNLMCGSAEKIVLDIIQDIPRIIPYSYDFNEKELRIKKKDGLLEYENEILYLEKSYLDILKENYDFLDKVRRISNKYKHKMHKIKTDFSCSGTNILFEFQFMVDGKEEYISSGALINLFLQTNLLFDRIIDDIEKYAYEEQIEKYVFIQRITKIRFEYFNSIYQSNILRNVGRIMYEF